MKVALFISALTWRNVALFFTGAILLGPCAYPQVTGINSVDGADLQIGAGESVDMWIKPPPYAACPGCVGIGTAQPQSILDIYGYITVNKIPMFLPPGDPSNTLVGYGALSVNPTDPQSVVNAGTNNTAAGEGTLQSNAGGTNNSALGASALSSNTTGSNNSLLGALSLTNNLSSNGNAVFRVCGNTFHRK